MTTNNAKLMGMFIVKSMGILSIGVLGMTIVSKEVSAYFEFIKNFE